MRFTKEGLRENIASLVLSRRPSKAFKALHVTPKCVLSDVEGPGDQRRFEQVALYHSKRTDSRLDTVS